MHPARKPLHPCNRAPAARCSGPNVPGAGHLTCGATVKGKDIAGFSGPGMGSVAPVIGTLTCGLPFRDQGGILAA